MYLTDEEIRDFEQALQGQPPKWDPSWKISRTLLEIVRVQADLILTLEERIRNLLDSHYRARTLLVGAIRGGMEEQVNPGSLRDDQVAEAIADLRNALNAAESGQQIVQYAGSVLKFVSKILV